MIEQERHVLVIFPHPDDEAFGVSGTITSYIKQGTPLTYACLTLGEMGRNLGKPTFATRESLPKIRRKELIKAADAMGIKDLRMMGLRDKTLEFEDDKEMKNMVSQLIDELNPSLVISFYPGYAVHPDHEATARAVVRALREINEKDRPKFHAVAFANNTEENLGQPDVVHDIRSVKDEKLNAMRAHISQTARMLEMLEEGIKVNDPEALKWVTDERFYTYDWNKDLVE
ncbi:bacillithiol biosynthesis deacetylase BshB2 [Halobacillus karajensis]|uniref:1D-myo-inositol 2-acetamido-2-deoxy-alpha-D-glucopyranoside deacetylase n=1 Tax=Halobacillus karajensis TaxID=195088 RepID=A0A024P4X9_9BACI|nr:bacillithiol biosynthesis deacetylase BshB2 [Halobacillus karajensis]CDQ20432.1 1D-myo-inositol 2-acetamido-2-deoxy-alpha-D-glucopyranoside deacetylase [Halobacillus karajensis]CDQ24099.1 1D-myo-inositol 2-acetamido-2-deoxy-alpha-D-glucopyranoside deacetylase [Halobacillus karajensis]CDQ27577.1 1D-myo-inositol 2-acetamido-2-deoxy-alpha-D-glucopyranoside deacetylase [Halobacillus karajensis]SEH91751.1 bacillithiol biosynthesis deacetylase BshB2 [Halobacillus karajensis]